MSIAQEAGITDPQLASYYNKMIEGKERQSAIKYVQTKEASRLKNLAFTKAVAPTGGVSQNQVDSLVDQIRILVGENSGLSARLAALESVASGGVS